MVHNCIRLGENVNFGVILLSHCSSSQGLYTAFIFPSFATLLRYQLGRKHKGWAKKNEIITLKGRYHKRGRCTDGFYYSLHNLLLVTPNNWEAKQLPAARGRESMQQFPWKVTVLICSRADSLPFRFTAIRGRACCTQLGMHVCPYHSSHRLSLLFPLSSSWRQNRWLGSSRTLGHRGGWKEMCDHYVLHNKRWVIFS